MMKSITMCVVGYEEFTINMETGIVTGKTYNAKEFLKSNFNAKWNKDGKCWMVDPEVVSKELENERYYAKYIVSKEETREGTVNETSADGVVAENQKETEVAIINEELVNKYDGFYKKITYSTGKIDYVFIG